MQLLTMTKPEDNCHIFSMAMLLNCEPSEIIDHLGHDGNEITWPEADEPRRGIHIQECQNLARERGCLLAPIQVMPASAPVGREKEAIILYTVDVGVQRFVQHVTGREGIIISQDHCYAWDGEQVYDPKGKIIELSDVSIVEAWLLCTI